MADNFKEGLQKLEKKVEEELEKYFITILTKLRDDASKILLKHGKYATGELVENIRYELRKEVAKFIGIVGVGANVRSKFRKNDFPYAIAVHEGTKPHWPNIGAIQRWVIIKGFTKFSGKPTNIRALRRNFFGSGRDRSEAKRVVNESRQIAFLIARKIAKKGTQGLPFLKLALEQNKDFIQSKFANIQL